MVSAFTDGDHMVNLCGWCTAVSALVLVAVHDVLSDACPAGWVLGIACAALPCWSCVSFAIGCIGYLGATCFVADAGSSRHYLGSVNEPSTWL